MTVNREPISFLASSWSLQPEAVPAFESMGAGQDKSSNLSSQARGKASSWPLLGLGSWFGVRPCAGDFGKEERQARAGKAGQRSVVNLRKDEGSG